MRKLPFDIGIAIKCAQREVLCETKCEMAVPIKQASTDGVLHVLYAFCVNRPEYSAQLLSKENLERDQFLTQENSSLS